MYPCIKTSCSIPNKYVVTVHQSKIKFLIVFYFSVLFYMFAFILFCLIYECVCVCVFPYLLYTGAFRDQRRGSYPLKLEL